MPLSFSTHVVAFGLPLALLGAVPGLAYAQAAQAPPASASAPVGASAVPTSGQTVAPSTGEPTPQADLDRVKQGLLTTPSLHLDPKAAAKVIESDARFYATAHGKEVTFEDIVGSFDLMNGPTPYAAMTHNEFMEMNRPHDAPGHVGLTDVAAGAALSLGVSAAEAIVLKAVQAIRAAKTAHEVVAIRAQMDKELAALAGTPIK